MTPCPACGAELFGWLTLAAGNGADVLLQRCESCGLGVSADLALESAPSALLRSARELPDDKLELRAANRASVQARLGGAHWAPLDPERLLYVTPESLPALAARAGLRVEELSCARSGLAQAWMWQTILNAFTFNRNFVREARAGRLRARGARLRFAIDALVSAVAALPVAFVSAPLELIAALAGSGGELVAVAAPADDRGGGRV